MNCTGTSKEWDHCRVEKMGCPGCYYCEKEEKDEQKTSEHSESKSD